MARRRSYRISRKTAKRSSRRSSRRSARRPSRKSGNESARILKFSVPKNSSKKYCAHLSNGRKVCFGAKGYQHYRDRTPKSKGGGRYHHLDHKDSSRRSSYRARHGAQGYNKRVNSPSYLAWKYLW